jgi:hypothetical protein
MGTLGAVKQYFTMLHSNLTSNDYKTQRDAMIQFLGVQPEHMIRRAPYQQGVEVFWLVTSPGNANQVIGFLQRTLQEDLVQYPGFSLSPPGNGMLQMTDVRAPSDLSLSFQVFVGDGFWITVNQSSKKDNELFHQLTSNESGLFQNMKAQGAATHTDLCTPFYAATPNVTKIYASGLSAFRINMNSCTDQVIQPAFYSLTCEPKAPFLTYEMNSTRQTFEELRNPGVFGQFMGLTQLDYHVQTEERESVPGKKGFVRLNGAHSNINLPNLAYQSWKTVTFAIRLYTTPVKETLFHFFAGKGTVAIIATHNGSTTSLSIEHNLEGKLQMVSTPFVLSLQKWYLCSVQNVGGKGFEISCSSMEDIVGRRTLLPSVSVYGKKLLYSPNALWNSPSGPNEPCNLMVGSKHAGGWPSLYGTASFLYDLAWIHFFDYRLNSSDRLLELIRECNADWIYTAIPETGRQYSTSF